MGRGMCVCGVVKDVFSEARGAGGGGGSGDEEEKKK